MGIFLQLYNLKTDEKTHKNNVSVNVQVFQGDKPVAHLTQTSEQLKQTGEELTLEQTMPLAALPPGKYRLQIDATDAVANQTVSRTTDFTVAQAAPDSKAAAEASPGR